MKAGKGRGLGCCLALLLAAGAEPCLADGAVAKKIRLRQEVTPLAGAMVEGAVAAEGAKGRLSGLYVIQLEGPAQPGWRERCRGLGVEWLRSVPEDAYVARFSNVSLPGLKGLGFVRWVGKFGPDRKLTPALARRLGAGGGGAGAGEESVQLLLAPGASVEEVGQVRGMLRRVDQQTGLRFGTIVRGRVDPAKLGALAQSEAVMWVEQGPRMRLYDEVATKIVAGDDGLAGTRALLHQLGYDGRGVTVAVADSGLDLGEAESVHPDLLGRVGAFMHYGNLEDAADEHGHGTHVAGIVAGDGATGETDETGALYGLGVAPGAEIVVQRLFDGVGNYEAPPSFEKLTRDAVRAGADIGSNSWGDDTQGRYDLSAMEFDALVRDADAARSGDQPYILEFSAGNAGPGYQTVGSPALAKNVIATGASQNNRMDLFIYADGQETMADFSSRGPCEDGRIKPDVVAPGTWIASLQSAGATDENAWLGISPSYQYQGGTSQAGPHVSGAAAVFVQYYRQTHTNATPSPALVKAALINSATDMDDAVETGPVPNVDEGWGRVDLMNLIGSERGYEMIDQTRRLSSGQSFEQRVTVAGSDQPLRITLAYTDVPGFPGAIPALVNDLDLEVIGPDGTVYRGNQMVDGESLAEPPDFDAINNVEAVHLAEPLPGEYRVLVHARKVVEDAIQATAETDQDFALVMSATLLPPGLSLVFLDRPAYRAPGMMGVSVVDRDLSGQSEVFVYLVSGTEAGVEVVRLRAASPNGSFTGMVATVTTPVVGDGQLAIQNGDLIEVYYYDESADALRSDTARGDFVPPQIGEPSVSDEYNRVYILFDTDEPATGQVRFGTDSALGQSVAAPVRSTEQEVLLPALVPGAIYSYVVVATDAAGNVATNDNGGLLFSFTAPVAAPVLLVDAWQLDYFEIPPLSGYTDGLDQAGIGYEVWDVGLYGSPTAQDLQPYRAVIWRVPEFGDTLTPDQVGALTNYLSRGGSLLMASMELTTRLGEAGLSSFRQNVLGVESFVEDVGVPAIAGVTGDAVTEGIEVVLDYTPYEDWFKELAEIPPDASDVFSPTAVAQAMLFCGEDVVGARFPRVGVDSPGRVIFLSFPVDAVPLEGEGPNNRGGFLWRLLSFLTPLDNSSRVELDRGAYTIPSVLTLEVTDLDQVGQGQVEATVTSETEPVGRTLLLRETTRSGVFRGSLTLDGAGGSSEGDVLRVTAGDIVRAHYFDVSANATVSTEAAVETNAPTILNVIHDVGYVDALIAWETSEPADALVQFGESILVERTAFVSELSSSHWVYLEGLQPDRVYYYRVVSRDAAGNAAVDDNQGQFYSFRTLQPLSAPWSDDLEQGAGDWQVIDGEGTELSWELGVPQNEFGMSAHSPAQAWGSNLHGQSSGWIESWLVSPPILLTGGNRATLRFWQNYQFYLFEWDLLEGGEVLLITNVATAPVELAVLGDSSLDWEEMSCDLSPYLGLVVYVVWHYALISFDDVPHPGWLVDDVSIEVTSITPGTIRVLNNLAQAYFVLAGPTARTGQGTEMVLTDAAPGDYQITFEEVPYYETPPPQSETLREGGNVVFSGVYTFPDANANGISDLWEQDQFGEVSPSRSASTDTDGDGQNDWAEFMSGTDPNLPGSMLAISAPQLLADGRLSLRWRAVAGREYCVQGSSDAQVWWNLTEWIRVSSGRYMNQPLPGPGSGQTLFYRVEVRP